MSFFQCFLINLILYSTEITVWTQIEAILSQFFRLRRADFFCNNYNQFSVSGYCGNIRISIQYYKHLGVGNMFTIYQTVYYRARTTLHSIFKTLPNGTVFPPLMIKLNDAYLSSVIKNMIYRMVWSASTIRKR